MAARETSWSIQNERAIAALVVVVRHTGCSRTVLGQSGVDLFFVVSGFVMMLVSGRDTSLFRFELWCMDLIVAGVALPGVDQRWRMVTGLASRIMRLSTWTASATSLA